MVLSFVNLQKYNIFFKNKSSNHLEFTNFCKILRLQQNPTKFCKTKGKVMFDFPFVLLGGSEEIRTLVTVARQTHFECAPL